MIQKLVSIAYQTENVVSTTKTIVTVTIVELVMVIVTQEHALQEQFADTITFVHSILF